MMWIYALVIVFIIVVVLLIPTVAFVATYNLSVAVAMVYGLPSEVSIAIAAAIVVGVTAQALGVKRQF
jgi:hypothetical protein